MGRRPTKQLFQPAFALALFMNLFLLSFSPCPRKDPLTSPFLSPNLFYFFNFLELFTRFTYRSSSSLIFPDFFFPFNRGLVGFPFLLTTALQRSCCASFSQPYFPSFAAESRLKAWEKRRLRKSIEACPLAHRHSRQPRRKNDGVLSSNYEK